MRRLWRRYRALPKWVRALVWLHLALLLLIGLGWGVVEYARRDIVAKVATPIARDAEAERKRLYDELYFAGFSWDENLGPLVRFNQRAKLYSLFVEWAPKNREIVSVSTSEAELRGSRITYSAPRPGSATPPPTVRLTFTSIPSGGHIARDESGNPHLYLDAQGKYHPVTGVLRSGPNEETIQYSGGEVRVPAPAPSRNFDNVSDTINSIDSDGKP